VAPAALRMLGTAMSRMLLSARAYHRVLKVARTIADLAGEERVDAAHAAEALAYRRGLLGDFNGSSAAAAAAPPA
jgi:magnesium chelatase family protein